MKENEILIPQDAGLSQRELIDKYTRYGELAAEFQMDDLSGFYAWKERRTRDIETFYV